MLKVENLSAWGVATKIRAGIDKEKVGNFFVLFDANAVVANPSKDPFFDVPALVAKARAASSMKGNPIELEEDELVEIARASL